MTNIHQPHPTRGPVGYGPTSFVDLVYGFCTLGAIGVGIYLLFHLPFLLSGLATILAGMVAGPWPSGSEILASLALGVVAGAIVGAARMRLNRKSRVLDELVGAVLSPDAITAAKVRWTVAVLAVAIGVGSGLAVGRLGIVGAAQGVATVVGPLLAGACFPDCPPGSGEGDLFVSLVVIALMVVFLSVLLSFGVTAVSAVAAKGLATGAVQGGGHAIGIALGIALSRLRTTRITVAGGYGTPGKLSFDAACTKFIEARPAERKEIIQPYLVWLRGRGIEPGPDTIGDHVDAYCAQSARAQEFASQKAKTAHLAKRQDEPGWNEQKHLRVPRGIARTAAELEKTVLRAFATEVPHEIARQNPLLRMTTTDGAPVFDGSPATLFHPRFLARSLWTGIREGAIVGLLTAVLSLGALLVSR